MFFRAPDLESALSLLPRLFVAPAVSSAPLLTARILSHRGLTTMIIAALLCFVPHLPRVARAGERATDARECPYLVPATAFGLVLFVLSFCSLANSSYNPFIYFRF